MDGNRGRAPRARRGRGNTPARGASRGRNNANNPPPTSSGSSDSSSTRSTQGSAAGDSRESPSVTPQAKETVPKMSDSFSTPVGETKKTSPTVEESTPAASNTQEQTPGQQQQEVEVPSPSVTDIEFSTPISTPDHVTTADSTIVETPKKKEEKASSDPAIPDITVESNKSAIEEEEQRNDTIIKQETSEIQTTKSDTKDNSASISSSTSRKSSVGVKIENENPNSNQLAIEPIVTSPSPVVIESSDITDTNTENNSKFVFGGASTGAGKPGYVGGTVGLHGGYESDDSLMTTSRRGSRSSAADLSVRTSIMGFTRRQVLTLLVFGLADFFSAIIISLQAPFYPHEAELKGATSTEYGLVFGVFELVVFITSPIYGRYITKVGPKLLFNVGIFTTGITTIMFGLLGLDAFGFDRTTFITLSFIVRSLEAMGDAAFITASFAIIAAEFPESVATTFASLETFFGLGLIVGPTVGGALYEKGGFPLPFAVMGGLLLVVAVLTLFLMPNVKPHPKTDKKAPGGILSVLKVNGVLLAAINIVAGAISIGFLNATLEPHIRQFNLTPVFTGLVFIINGGLYAITAPIFGFICDRKNAPRHILLVGAVVTAIGFLFIGPVPFIPIETTLWLTCVGLVIHGIGLGSTLVASFILALREAIASGFSDNIGTYGLTSALWTSSFALGSFIGPSVGGVLLYYAEFRYASLFVFAVQVFLMVLIIAYNTNYKATPEKSYTESNLTEAAPLLGSNDPCSSKSLTSGEGSGKNYGATVEC